MGVEPQLARAPRPSTPAAARPPPRGDLARGVEVDQLAVEPVADRAPHVLLDQAAGNRPRPPPGVVVERRLGDARRRQRQQRRRLLGARLRVHDPHLDGAEAESAGACSTRSACARRSSCVAKQEVDVVRVRLASSPKWSGTPQRGKLRVKIWVRAECRPLNTPLDPGRVRRGGQQRRQHRPQRVADRDRPVGVPDADVHVVAEGVVAPGHVLEPSSTRR